MVVVSSTLVALVHWWIYFCSGYNHCCRCRIHGVQFQEQRASFWTHTELQVVVPPIEIDRNSYDSVVPPVDVTFKPHPEFSNLTDPVSTRLWHDMRKFSYCVVEFTLSKS